MLPVTPIPSHARQEHNLQHLTMDHEALIKISFKGLFCITFEGQCWLAFASESSNLHPDGLATSFAANLVDYDACGKAVSGGLNIPQVRSSRHDNLDITHAAPEADGCAQSRGWPSTCGAA